MKIIKLLALALLPFAVNAQAPVPTSWDFAGNAPQGWSQNGTATYSSGALVVVAPSCKLDNTADYVQVFLADAPGYVKWFIGGATANGNPWSGTFSVQQSVNGSTWTDLKVYTTLAVSGGLVADSALANNASRYIRFYFTNKVSGSNVALDDVAVRVAPPSPEQEINVKYNGVSYPTGSTVYINAPVSTATPFAFNVENVGITNALTVTQPVFSGPNAGDFVVNNFPSGVNANSSSPINITFTPGAAGTRLAQLSIPNNDANENPYILNIYGIGGQFASEPTAQASNLTFPITKSYRIKGQFSSANPPVDGGYLVLRKDVNTITEAPVDGQTYVKGDYIGGAQVVSVGQATSFVPSYIIAATDYYFAVFAYNGNGAYTNYAQTAPLTGMVTTPGANPGSYYNGIDANSSTFPAALGALINPHQATFYGNYDETMVNNFQARDTTGGNKVITCAYTGNQYVYAPPFTWDTYSREHTFCHAWMASNPADEPEKPEYNDQHNLFPVIFAQANLPRSDNPLGIVDSVLAQFEDGKYGYDSQLNIVYEPRDVHKGRAARALFYMPTCYDGINNLQWSLPAGQNELILKQWHFQFPPDNFDKARNEYIDSLQENRNPFIDNPNWVCYINFHTMQYISNPTVPCNTVSTTENTATQFDINVFPVPTTDHINVRVVAEKNEDVEMMVTDMTGRVIYSRNVNMAKGPNLYDIHLGAFDAGMYNLTIRTNGALTSRRLVVVH
ncbi:MAG: endonuclease [Sphingobacteriales bacterium JAD_PAG50586_3]|nr:MAG: endonuclease [Sphingobacteriales bacterium JAD_PAG50586_3]